MKKYLFFLFLLAGGTLSFAQPVQTIYYKNGRKYMEGHWTFTKRTLIPQVLGVQGSLQFRPGNYRSFNSGVLDVEQALKEKNPWWLARTQVGYLELKPEGTVTYWGPDGTDYRQVTYTGGEPNGAFAEFYGPGKPLQGGNITDGMPNGPWTYYYKNGKPFYTGAYKALSQAQMESLWAGDYTKLKAGEQGSRSFLINGFEGFTVLADFLNVSRLFYNILLEGSLKDGPFNFWYKNGAKWAEIAFDSDQPTGIWKIWEAPQKDPKLVLEWTAGSIAFVTDSAGRRTSLETRLEEKEEAMRKIREALSSRPPNTSPADARNKRSQSNIKEGLPGLVKAPATSTKKERSAPDTPLVYYYVQQMPQFDGDVHEWLAENTRATPMADKEDAARQVIVKFIVQPNGTLTNIEVHKGVRSDLDAEALRLVNTMPKWKAGKQNGELVPVHYKLSVRFAIR